MLYSKKVEADEFRKKFKAEAAQRNHMEREKLIFENYCK
jgi:hypothetical protein